MTRSRSSPVRVGFVLHAMHVAGAEVLVTEIIERLGRRIEPVVYCLDAVGALGERLRAQGVSVHVLGRVRGRDWAVVWKLGQRFATDRVEVVHAHQYTPFFYAALAKAISRRPPRLILTEHGRHCPDVVGSLRRAVNRLVLDRLADAVNGVSRFSVRSLCRPDGFAGARMEVIPNGIRPERYATGVDRKAVWGRLGIDAGRRIAISVARFHPIKDHATLIEGFSRLAPSVENLDLVLAGDGILRSELEQRVRRRGIEHRVHFLGVRNDVPVLLQAADIFCMTSICEAASLTVLEAMAAGLPVVLTRVGGNPELVRDGKEGRLIAPRRPEQVAAALKEMLERPDWAKRLGQAGRRRVREHFTLERTVARYGRLYERLAPGRLRSAVIAP